jgi:NAD(P)-dependent dehydrogenase (short-subunit alcohol dehydrogenase family)
VQADADDPQAVACDVRSDEAVQAALAETIERIGLPRVCIQCAGIAPAGRMVGKQGAMPLDAFKQVIDINLVGTFNVMRVFAEAIINAPEALDGEEQGVVINTASIAAYEGQVGQTAYSASKGGIVALTLPAARELAASGIRVNTIAPGLIATPLLLNMPEEVQASLAESVPFPKRLGKPEEFASLAAHIIENSLINGEVIRLDGALRMAPR